MRMLLGLRNAIRRAQERASIRENQRMRKLQLEHDLESVDGLHELAVEEHRAACQRQHVNPSPENYAATWRCYDRTWELFNDYFEIRKRLDILSKGVQ